MCVLAFTLNRAAKRTRKIIAFGAYAATAFLALATQSVDAGDRQAWINPIFINTAPRPPRAMLTGSGVWRANRPVLRRAQVRPSKPVRSESAVTNAARPVAASPVTAKFPPVTPLE